MRLCCDRTGFPLLEWAEAGLAVSLWPVTKVQFECFLAEPNEFGDKWYEEVLAVSPRVPWRQFDTGNRERLFLTGIQPNEALAFARWLGEDFDLPTEAEWRDMAHWLINRDLEAGERWMRACPMHRTAETILRTLRLQMKPKTWGELTLLRGGVWEWVRCAKGYAGLGSPRPEFKPNTINPERDDPVRPLRGEKRSSYFGFRLVRRRPAEEITV